MIRAPTLSDLSLLLILMIVWASAFLAIKVVVPETGPLWLATIRVVIGFAVLLPWAIWHGLQWPADSRQWRLIVIIAILNVVAPYFLISWAEQTINAGVASLLMGLGPIMALIASHFFTQDDKFTMMKFLAIILGFSGVLVVVGVDALSGLGANFLAQCAALLGSACYVASNILVRKLPSFPPVRLSCLVLGIASIILISISMGYEGFPNQNLSQQSWILLLYLGVFPTGLAYLLRYYLVQAIGVSAFSLGINLIPVIGIAMSAVLLNEPVSWTLLVALCLILSGLFLIRLAHKKA